MKVIMIFFTDTGNQKEWNSSGIEQEKGKISYQVSETALKSERVHFPRPS